MSASYDYESLTPDNYAFSPAIALPDDDGFVLEYWVANYSSTYPEYLSVYIVGENTVAAVTAATAVESYEVSSTTYTKHTVSLNDYAGQTVYIVFRHHNSYDEWMFYIDDVIVRQTGAPMITLAGPANTQTGTDATFVVTLTEGQTPTYTWTSAMADAGLATITGGGDTAIVNYSAGGTDTVTVVATNAFGSATAFRTVTVIDCGSAAELPWTADLSSNTAVQCWNFVNAGSSTNNWSRSAGSGNPYLSSRGDNTWAVTPLIQMPASAEGTILEYNVRGYNNNTYEVWVSPDGGANVSDFTDSLFGETYTANSYAARTVDLSAYSGQQIRIAFRHTHQGSNNNAMRLQAIGVRQTTVPVISITGPASVDAGVGGSYAIVVSEGTIEGISYSWSSLMATAGQATIAATDSTATITYSAGGEDIITATATNAHGTATATYAVHVRQCTDITELPWNASLSSSNGIECWTFIDNDNNNYNWSRGGTGSVNSYLSSRGADDWAVTPAIQIPAATAGGDGCILEWSVRGFSACTYQVWVSPSAGTDVADFTDSLFAEAYTSSSNYASRTLSLADYAGQTVRIAFRHTGAGSNNNSIRLRGIGVRLTDAPVVSLSGATTTNVNIAETYTATLTEGVSTGLTWSWTSTMEAAGNATMVEADSTMTITYTAAGRDTITVVATNAFGSNSRTLYVTVVDLNPVGTFPYTTGFEGANTDNINWQLISSSSANAWAIGSATSNGDSNALYISNNGGTTYGYNNSSETHAYAYRVFNLEAGEYNFAYDWRCVGEYSSYSTYDYMRVFLAPGSFEPSGSTTGLDYSSTPAGFMALDGGVALVGQASWTTTMQTVTITTPGLYKMVFYWRDDSSDSDGDPAAIDNVSVSNNSCPMTTGLTATAVTANTVTLGWTAGGDETEWVVTADGIDHLATTNSYTVSGLDANTLYTFSVRAVCSADDTSLATSLTVRTECDGGNCNFTVNMVDSYGDGWNGSAGINIVQGGATVATATFPSTGSYSDYTLSADFSICAGQPISLSWNAGSYDYEDSFTIVLADGTVVFSVDSCSTLTPGEVFLTFDASCNVEGGEPGPGPGPGPGPQPQPDTCYVPTNLHLVGATSSAITLDWTPAGSESQWQLQIDGAAQPVSVSSHPYVVSGLTASTTYNVKVRAVCGTDNYSDWSAAVSVATAAGEEPGPGPGEGIADVFAASVVLSPNPASSTVSIGADGLRSVELIDMTGRVRGEWKVESGEIKIDVGQMARGVYFVRLHADGFTATRKLIVSAK